MLGKNVMFFYLAWQISFIYVLCSHGTFRNISYIFISFMCEVRSLYTTSYSLTTFLSSLELPFESFFYKFVINNNFSKKVNFTLEQTMKAQRGSRGIALLYH